jgi:hypothetical protein
MVAEISRFDWRFPRDAPPRLSLPSSSSGDSRLALMCRTLLILLNVFFAQTLRKSETTSLIFVKRFVEIECMSGIECPWVRDSLVPGIYGCR